MTPAATSVDEPCLPAPEALARIGIMADSHGRADLIDTADTVLQTRGCVQCIHLGDIIDTARPETIEDCLNGLAARQIKAIRGNNEHTLLLNRSAWVADNILEVIRAMPFGRRIGSALLAHSQPFEAALGARCLLEDMDSGRLRRFFRTYPGMQLFRGHSHQPEMVLFKGASLNREPLRPGRPVPLTSGQPAVVTCGALADGLCLVWDRQEETVELVSLASV